MKAFVAGATGRTGRWIVEELRCLRQAEPSRNIPVRALVRDVQLAKTILSPDIELVTGDILKQDSIFTALDDSTVVFSALGAKPNFDPTGPFQADYLATRNLVDAAVARKVEHIVLVSSICVSQFFHPLNLFWLVLFWKKQAEEYIQKSGITYTIVRPGGLKDEDNSDPIVMEGADKLSGGSISRRKVAQVCVASIFEPAARNKIIEVVANPEADIKSFGELFEHIASGA
jgi:uncharacterized protein YbjT (DUF2867 family)